MTKEQIWNAINIIKKNGLQLRLQFILGAPYEDIKMMEESFELAKKSKADYVLFPILIPIQSTEMKDMCEKEGLIEKRDLENFQDMFVNPVVRTKYATSEQIKKLVDKIRKYQMKRYISEGLRMGGPAFLKDLAMFLLYYKPKYDLEMDHAFRFTVNKYKLKKLEN